jgi:hypothetical protein
MYEKTPSAVLDPWTRDEFIRGDERGGVCVFCLASLRSMNECVEFWNLHPPRWLFTPRRVGGIHSGCLSLEALIHRFRQPPGSHDSRGI